MTTQHIEIQSTVSRLSAEVRGFVDSARALQDRAQKIKDIFDQVSFEGDWASLSTKLGVDVTDADTVYNLITNIVDELTSSDYNALIDRLG